MTEFDRLTPVGRMRRLRALAREALDAYHIGPVRFHLLKYSWNTVFHVVAEDGARYALRISRPGVRDLLAIESELTWIAALDRDTNIMVPTPVRTPDGALVLEVSIPSVPGSRYISLFHWIAGRHAIHMPSERVISLLGETMALLHTHAETFVPPEHFTPDRLDRLGTFSGTSQIYADEPHALLRGERLDLFRREAARVQAELDRLYQGREGPWFLHLDMHLGNIKLVGDGLAVLDFDDSMWAYPVQDIAITLYYLHYMRRFSKALQAALARGYRRVRDWPEEWAGQIELLIEARALSLVDVLLSMDHPRVQARLPDLLQGIEEQIRALSGHR